MDTSITDRPGARLAILLPLAVFSLLSLPAVAAPHPIEVAADGSGDFTTIQAALDQAPAGGADWTVIHIAAGHYFEKVTVPSDKGPVVLVGDGRDATVLEFDESFLDKTGALVAKRVLTNNAPGLELLQCCGAAGHSPTERPRVREQLRRADRQTPDEERG